MTNSASSLSAAIGALALGITALALATSGDLFRSALLGIAAYLIFNVLLWVAAQAWPAPAPPVASRIADVTDEPAAAVDDEPALPPSPPSVEGG